MGRTLHEAEIVSPHALNDSSLLKKKKKKKELL